MDSHSAPLLPPLSPSAPGALYEQIVAGVKHEISAGRLAPGAALPSFRQLAEDMMVSLITVKRAYEELEREGIVFRRQGLAPSSRKRPTTSPARLAQNGAQAFHSSHRRGPAGRT